MRNRAWYDSFPGLDLSRDHAVLDSYGTPFSGTEHLLNRPLVVAIDAMVDPRIPYCNIGQNRGGVA